MTLKDLLNGVANWGWLVVGFIAALLLALFKR
jgi:hypothetical protein